MSPADVFVLPDLRRKRVSVKCAGGPVQIAVAGTGLAAEGENGEAGLDFSACEPWSPESPLLHALEVTSGGETCAVRFGMRDFTAKDYRFHLNGRPLHLKGVHHFLDYPEGADEAALMRAEIQLAKDAGFSLIHLHAHPYASRFLSIADELGVLVWLDLTGLGTPEAREAAVRACRNHVSLAAWLTPAADDRVHDPSRLWLLPATDTRPGQLYRPYRNEPDPFDDVRMIRRAPVGPQTEDLLRACGQPDQVSFLAAFGFGGLSQAGLAVASDKAALAAQALAAGHAARDLASVFLSVEEMAAAAVSLQSDAVRYQLDAARANPKLAGYCWVQLCDAPGNFCAGLLDEHRRPKPAYEVVKRVQKPMRPLIQMTATNLRPRQEVPVTVLLANEERAEGRCDISLQVVGPTNQVLWKKRRSAKLPRHTKELWNGAIGASGSPGKHRFIVRVLDGIKVLAEAGQDFNVYDTPAPCEVAVHVIDPRNEWAARVAGFVKPESILAPVIIVPAITTSVYGYPDEVLQALAQVKGGAVAVFFAPPADWNDLAAQLDDVLALHPCDATGGIAPAMHYVKVHPIFEGAQNRCLMRQPFRYVAPQAAFRDASDEDIAGTFNAWLLEHDGEAGAWASDIVVRRYGSGRILFTHLRILESLGTDPLADRLFINLINHCARRSVAPGGLQPAPTRAQEWLKAGRGTQARRWMLIGEFPNWNGTGHNAAYPPEAAIELAARYPGWHGPVGWRPWHTLSTQGHALDLHAALNFREPGLSHANGGTAYAYAEFSADRRLDARLAVISAHACKVWLNGALVLARDQPADYRPADSMSPVLVKQGRNTLLIKSSQSIGPHTIEAGISSASREPLNITWWR